MQGHRSLLKQQFSVKPWVQAEFCHPALKIDRLDQLRQHALSCVTLMLIALPKAAQWCRQRRRSVTMHISSHGLQSGITAQLDAIGIDDAFSACTLRAIDLYAL